MDQLTSLDASWLLAESAEMPLHIANLLVFDKPAQPIKEVVATFRDHLEAKSGDLPVFYRKVDLRSLQMANPVWLNDPEIDWDYHYRTITLPKPGDDAALNDLICKIHEPMLDRRKPLWQCYVIDGLKGGGFAVYFKVHHAAVDGAAVNLLLDALFSEESLKRKPTPLPKADSEPNPMELMMGTWKNFWVDGPRKMMSAVPEIMKNSVVNMKENGAKIDLEEFKSLLKPVPHTVFNTSLTPSRGFGRAHLSLSEVKTFGKKHGGTINDMVLAITTGALRRYLMEKGNLPDSRLTVGMPVSVREPENKELTNQMFIMTAQLPTDEAEPAARVPLINDSVAKAKAQFKQMEPMAKMIVGLPSTRTPGMVNISSMMEAVKAVDDMGLTSRLNPFVNLWLSNVPGPRNPLYVAGNAAKTNLPVGFPMHGSALVVTVLSYMDSLDFGLITSSDIVPDTQRLADLLVEEWDVLKKSMEGKK